MSACETHSNDNANRSNAMAQNDSNPNELHPESDLGSGPPTEIELPKELVPKELDELPKELESGQFELTQESSELPADDLPAVEKAIAPDVVASPVEIEAANKRMFSAISRQGFRPKMVRWRRQLAQINALEATLRQEDDASLRKRSLALRYRAMAGEKLPTLLPESYALVREAGRRTLSMRHYDVQIVGGIALFEGNIAEMQTGEGKTLTATLPLYLHSLVGKGAHLATVNDYLAKRDAEWMRPVYEMLGLSVGIIQTADDQGARRIAYAAPVTYGTAKEFGFDFLRDRLLLRAQNRLQTEMLGDGGGGFSGSGDQPVMRGMHFCLVDEADSILIDEARTPLIIGSIEDNVRDQIVQTYRWAAKHADEYEIEEHFTIDDDTKQYELTARGRQKVRSLPKNRLGPHDGPGRLVRVHRTGDQSPS